MSTTSGCSLSRPSSEFKSTKTAARDLAIPVCHLVGSRTLLTVGGLESIEEIETSPNNTDGLLPCDWEIKGVGVLEISSIHWGSAHNAESPAYEVPAQVFSTIGGR